MRRFFLFMSLVLVISVPAFAQDTPKVEVFGGYSYFHTPPGYYSNQGGGPYTSVSNNPSLNGWNVSVAGNVNSWLGIVADLGGYYANAETATFVHGIIPTTAFGTTNVRLYSFLFGPQLSYRKNERFTPFIHALFGGVRQSFGPEITAVANPQTDFGMALGAGCDVKASEHLAIRVIQADYVRTRFGFKAENNVRLSFGVVARF